VEIGGLSLHLPTEGEGGWLFDVRLGRLTPSSKRIRAWRGRETFRRMETGNRHSVNLLDNREGCFLREIPGA